MIKDENVLIVTKEMKLNWKILVASLIGIAVGLGLGFRIGSSFENGGKEKVENKGDEGQSGFTGKNLIESWLKFEQSVKR